MPLHDANSALDKDNDYFSAKVFKNILCIRFKGNLLLHSVNLRCRDHIIGYLHRVSDSMKDLAEYLENETQELMNIVRPRAAW